MRLQRNIYIQSRTCCATFLRGGLKRKVSARWAQARRQWKSGALRVWSHNDNLTALFEVHGALTNVLLI
jgi:hypothetical protein